MTRLQRLLLVAAAVAVVGVGLPWSRQPVGLDVVNAATGPHTVGLGSQHPVRVLAVVGALLIWAGLRRGSRRAALAGVAVAAGALPIGGWDGAPGRVCYLLAVLIAAAAIVTQRPGADLPAS